MVRSPLGDQCHPSATCRHDTLEEAGLETQALQGHVQTGVRADHEAGEAQGEVEVPGGGSGEQGPPPLRGAAYPDCDPPL